VNAITQAGYMTIANIEHKKAAILKNRCFFDWSYEVVEL